jgi:hypothetical protein
MTRVRITSLFLATRTSVIFSGVLALLSGFAPANSQPVNSRLKDLNSPYRPGAIIRNPESSGIKLKDKSSIFTLKQSIVTISPQVGTGGTKVLLTGLRPFSPGPVTVKFGALAAAYASVNPDGTITAGAPYTGQPGKSVRISVMTSGKASVESLDLFSYPIAHLEVTGPMPMDPSSIGDARWASGRGHSMVSYAPNIVTFAEQPIFHVSAAFVDDTMASPASYTPPYAVGNYGLFGAHLQNCDVSRPSAPGPSQCENWDGNSGTWVDATPAVNLRLNRGKPDTGVSGDIELKTTGLFDQANLVRTLRVAMTVQENDTIRGIGSDRVDSKNTSPFIAVVAPSAFIQVKVIPFTIVYQPPGNASTTFYQTSNTYSTSLKLGNSSEQNNSSSTQETKSTKASIKLTVPLFGSSAGFGIDLGESWDNSTKTGFGTSETSTNTSTNTVAFQTQWNIPANPDLIPGDGSTCKSATDCSLQTQPANPRAIEPFWGDTFVFSVHPQFAMWVLDAGRTRYVQIAAVPVTADATVAQLAACWLGSTTWPGGKPCDLQYSQSILQSENGAPVSYAGSQNHVTLTAEEAHRFLLLDPFFQEGQNANVRADRAIVVLNGQYGGKIGERPRPLQQSLTRTMAEASDEGGTQTTTLSVTSIRGTDSSFNVAESLFGVFGLSGATTSGTKLSTSADLKATFNSSTAVTVTNATQAQVLLNDQDTTIAGCSLPHCHLPLLDRPKVNVYLDKQFGGFMFQDPGAPAGTGTIALAPASIRDRTELAIVAIKNGSIQAAKPVLDGRSIRENIHEVIDQRHLANPQLAPLNRRNIPE